MSATPTRFTLRDLPLPAKLVLSAFLISVGLGYLSAMVQLHLKHSSKQGEPLPTMLDVIERFSGLKPHDPNAPPEHCTVSLLLSGDVNDEDVSKTNMAPAFKAKSKGYEKECVARGKPLIDAQRDGEWAAMIAWVQADAERKKSSYAANSFPLPDDIKSRPITETFLTADKSGLKVKDLFDARCQNCHAEQAPSLASYQEIEPLVTPPSREVIGGKWVRSNKQISTEALTQSTHAHLLSFSMLFALTGLTFAFSGFPGFVRGVIGPLALIGQVADISCWWLARVPDYGPYFAQTIVVTGGIVGMSLVIQILGSLFSMYGPKGKVVMMLVVLLGLAIFGTVGMKVIEPALKAEREEAAKPKAVPAPKKQDTPKPIVKPEVKPETPQSALEKLLSSKREDKLPWNGKGSMVPAFFEKDGGDFKQAIKDRPEAEVVAEREGERVAVIAWLRLDDAARKKAFEDDKLPTPTELSGKPITPDYRSDDKASVKVKTILADRCARCHCAGGDQEDYPLETYEQLAKYFAPPATKAAPIPKAE